MTHDISSGATDIPASTRGATDIPASTRRFVVGVVILGAAVMAMTTLGVVVLMQALSA